MTTSTGILNSKDFTLTNLLLLTAVDSFDLKNMMIEVAYTEDIFDNSSYGYVMISEAMGYIETLALMGNEFIRLTFSKTGDPSTKIDKVFRVYKLGKRQLEGTMYKESYLLYFCSEELILSSQYKISKSYKNYIVSDVVTDILNTYLKIPSNKNGVIETTYGQYDFILPTISPFDAINWLTNYARTNPTNGAGSDMLFFEDKFGFNFRSLQTLMKQPSYYTYTYKPKNLNSGDLNTEVYNVSTYEILNSYDVLDGIHSGVFANQLISVNPLTRTRKATNFDYNAYSTGLAGQSGAGSILTNPTFGNPPIQIEQTTTPGKLLNPYPIINNFTNRNGDALNQTPQALVKLVFSNFDSNQNSYVAQGPPNSGGNDIFAETYIPYRTAQLSLANYTRIRISVPGDSNLTVGRVITFNLATKNPNSNELDKYYSGNYLITGVKHLIGLTEYKTILEITKESVPTQYPGTDNNSSIYKNTVKGII
jgi:hypothetical protein